MEPILREEHKTAHYGQMPVHHQENPEPNKFKAGFRRIYQRLGQFSYLEIVGMTAIAILVFDQFFAISIAVTQKPLLQKMLSGKTVAQSQPPKLAPNAPAAGQPTQPQASPADAGLIAEVLPAGGVELPVVWGNLGEQMIKAGVIDRQKFIDLYSQRGGLSAEGSKMLTAADNGKIKITSDNSGTILNLLWALGLGNKNEILDKGEMQDSKYGGAGKFASTGGWSISAGSPMDHYSKHQFIRLTVEQQAMVDKVSKNIFRPCCGNSTHFPDCNHGMAMLALLELMASQGVSEPDMYKAALAVNSYWFPNNYLTIAAYFKKQGTEWNKVSPQAALSAEYSSGQGYQQLLQKVNPQQAPKSQGGCGV